VFLRDPYWLILLLFLPPVLFLFLRRRHFGSLRFPSLRHFRRTPRSPRLLLLPLPPLLRTAALGLLIFALARPQEGTEIRRDFSKGVAIMMALDTSGSMRAEDFRIDDRPVSRLEAVKSVFRAFVLGDDSLPGRPNDEIGIVAFGGFAVSRAPLTLDHTALCDILKSIRVPEEIRDEQGRIINREESMTAIGDGLALAVARLKENMDNLRKRRAEEGLKGKDLKRSNVVILLSDGVSNAGDVEPEAAARAAKEFGIKVYTIGIGHEGYAPMPVIDVFGRKRYMSVRVDFDPETLKRIARITGGKYFHAENTDALREIYSEIDRMEKARIESKVFLRFKELFDRYLWIAFVVLLVEVFLSHTYLRRIP